MLQKNKATREYEMEAELDYLARKSKLAYEELTKRPDSFSFMRRQTPNDAIEKSKIGSRPSRRTGPAPWRLAGNPLGF